MRAQNENGQLLLPILGVLFLFGMFWVTYVFWCRTVYWKMRMDVTSDMVALSAARDQAEQLNYMATCQWLENPFMQKAKVFSKNIAHMQVAARNGFEAMNGLLRLFDLKFEKEVYGVAQMVAEKNGADLPAVPLESYGHQLQAQSVHVFYFADLIYVGDVNYEKAYFTRTWNTRETHPQPPHENRWLTCHGSICQDGRAHLWLDVLSGDIANNGGFPSAEASFLRSLGFQCFYPQFNARLLPKK